MNSVFLYGPRDLRIVDVPPGPLGPGDVRIAVAYSGICGTELHLYAGMAYGPSSATSRPLGHEFVGRVTEVGSQVSGLRVGDRVTAIPNAACGNCAHCRGGRAGVCLQRSVVRDGSWAPSLVAPAQNVYVLPSGVSDRAGALTEPLACALRAIDRADLRSGDRVFIVGAGPVGLMLLALTRVSGASATYVSEPRAFRRDLARQLGADVVLDPAEGDPVAAVRDLTDGRGADVVFEVVGLPRTIEQAIDAAAPGGTVVIVGVADAGARASFIPQDLFFKELTIRGTKGPTHAVDRALRLLTVLDLEPIVTHVFTLDEVRTAVELALTGDVGKVLLQPE